MDTWSKIWLGGTIIFLISGSVLIHFGETTLGIDFLLIGLILAWYWFPLSYLRNWFKNRKKVQ